MRTVLGLAICALGAGAALASDVAVRGDSLRLHASARNAERRGAVAWLKDAAIAPPFADPRVDGATLVVHGGSSADECFVRADLPAARWSPIGRDGTRRGWRYRDKTGAAAGVRRVLVRPGRLSLVAKGTSWPCGLPKRERLPVSVVLGLSSGQRWCAAFGGTVAVNAPGRFRARGAPAPAACPDGDLTMANLNVLHGLFCPGTNSCRFADRAALLFQWVAAAGCPDVVTLQEVRAGSQVTTLVGGLPGLCGGVYQAVYDPMNRVDDAMLLTRIPVLDFEVVPLAGNFRNVLRARLDHPLGPVDVFTTHLAATTDGALLPCAGRCPDECVAAGAATLRECQGVQVARLVEARRDIATPAVIGGDFNEEPASFVHAQFTMRGWSDSYLVAGNPECDPGTGVGCTSGRVDDALTELESRASNEVERIDFIFVTPAAGCRIEPAGDPDGDGTSTGLFADQPNPFAPTCGPAPAPICWPSDHVGAQLDLECR